MEDFLHPEGKVSLFREETPVRTDSTLLSSLYFYWVSNDQSGKVLTPSEIRARKTALKCVKVGTLHYRITYCLKWSSSVVVYGRCSCHLCQIKPFRFAAFPLVMLLCHGNWVDHQAPTPVFPATVAIGLYEVSTQTYTQGWTYPFSHSNLITAPRKNACRLSAFQSIGIIS